MTSIDSEIYTVKSGNRADLTVEYISNAAGLKIYILPHLEISRRGPVENPDPQGLENSFASRRWFRERSADDKEPSIEIIYLLTIAVTR